MNSTPFQGSKQCQALLKYLVEHSLGGSDVPLKERTIGIEVFGKSADYSTAEDAAARARIAEVRKRLAQYYVSDESRGCAVQIVLAPGSYRPTFILHHGSSGNWESGTAASAGLKVPGRMRLRVWGLAAVAACTLLFFVAWIGIRHWTKSELDLFWGPFLDSNKPVVIYTGAAMVYIPAEASAKKAMALAAHDNSEQPVLEWGEPPLAGGQGLTADDIKIDAVHYTGTGDLVSAVRVAELLNASHRSLDVRTGSYLPLDDIEGFPSVLIGAGSNFWTMETSRELPYFFDRGMIIRERGGQGRVWSITPWSDSPFKYDYAIVARLLNTKTNAPIIILAGITTCGTQAAGDFVTNPVQLNKAGIPRDALEHKNIELVLHMSLVDCSPTSMDIVAMRSW